MYLCEQVKEVEGMKWPAVALRCSTFVIGCAFLRFLWEQSPVEYGDLSFVRP